MIIFSSIKADKTMEWFRRREKIFRRKLIWSRMGFFFRIKQVKRQSNGHIIPWL